MSMVAFIGQDPLNCAVADVWCGFIADVAKRLPAVFCGVIDDDRLLRGGEGGWASTTRAIGRRASVLEFFPEPLGSQ